MRKLLLTLLILTLLPLIQASPTYCYQESANIATSCGGLDTGTYSGLDMYGLTTPEFAIDSDWNTSASAFDTNPCIDINYTIPTNTINAIWQIKDVLSLRNITIDNSALINTILSVRACSFIENDVRWYIFNTTWTLISSSGHLTDTPLIYEEAMIWEIDNDFDNDGILNDADKCPNTVGEQLIYGCSCKQILNLKPGEDSEVCSKGITKIFTNSIGWAKSIFS